MSKPQRRRRRRGIVKRDANQEVAIREEREVSLLELERPDFLSLVKSPANRSPFGIVRSADGKVKRQRRSDGSALLDLTVTGELEDDELNDVMSSFGITTEEYEIERRDGNTYMKRKRDDDEEVDPITMTIATGIVATLDRNVINRSQKRDDNPVDRPSLTVVKLTFDKDEFADRDSAVAWLAERSIEYTDEDLFAVAGESVLVRHDYGKEADLKDISLGGGVTATVAHTVRDDIPQVIYRQIVEEAYGNYGYGHIDFFQAMVDQEFTRDAKDANYWLWDVLDNIIFYSNLPLSDRLSLVENAMGEYLAWITALMQSLPREVLTSSGTVDLNSQGGEDTTTASDEDDSTGDDTETTETEIKETADMSKEDKAKQESKAVEREDEQLEQEEGQASAESEDGQGTDEGQSDMVTLSRSDLDEALANAGKAGAEAALEQVGKTFTRSDDGEAEQEEEVDPMVAAVGAAVGAAMEPVIQRLDKLEEAGKETVVRDDAEDDGEDEGEGEQEGILRSDDEDWARGSIFRRNAGRFYGTGGANRG